MTGLVPISDGSVSGVTEDAAIRLGRLIRERRKALKLTQADIQAAGGPSTATLRLIEGGKHTDFRPSTSQPLEKALQWTPGDINHILEGKDPTPVRQVSGGASLTVDANTSASGVVIRPGRAEMTVTGHSPRVSVSNDAEALGPALNDALGAVYRLSEVAWELQNMQAMAAASQASVLFTNLSTTLANEALDAMKGPIDIGYPLGDLTVAARTEDDPKEDVSE